MDLSYNFLKFIPEDVAKLVKLQELLVGNNEISSLPSEMCQLPCLQTLSLHHNQLDHGWVTVEQNLFPALVSLDLSFNAFGEIPPSLCECTALQELNLSHNHLSYLREELPLTKWTNMLILDLSYNQLVKFGPQASRSSSYFSFLSNSFYFPFDADYCYRNLCSLVELVVLNLAFNELVMLPNGIWKLKFLGSLKIEGNPKLVEEFGLTEEILSRGTKTLLEYLKARQSETISSTQHL